MVPVVPSLLFYNLHMWNKAFVAFIIWALCDGHVDDLVLDRLSLDLYQSQAGTFPRWFTIRRWQLMEVTAKHEANQANNESKNLQLCWWCVDHRDRAADSVAVNGLYVIRNRWKSCATRRPFPRRNQSCLNYLGAYQRLSILAVCKNTLFITVLVVFGNVLSNSFIAYGFCKIGLSRKNLIFALVLSTMMIPGFVTMIPPICLVFQNQQIRYLSAADRSACFSAAPFNIFLMQRFAVRQQWTVEAASDR